jgi:hypothetical protein
MLNTVAPEMMGAVRDTQQQNSIAPLPPEVEQALQQATQPPTEQQGVTQ